MVSRQVEARFKVIVSIDVVAVDMAAKKAADNDHDGNLIKYADAYKLILADADSELKQVKTTSLVSLQSKYDLDLQLAEFEYLKISFPHLSSLEFRHAGGEVLDVEDPTYTLESF